MPPTVRMGKMDKLNPMYIKMLVKVPVTKYPIAMEACKRIAKMGVCKLGLL